MKARLINEKISFNRGGNPLEKMNVGMGIKADIQKIIDSLDLFDIRIYHREDEEGIQQLIIKDESGYTEHGYFENDLWELDYIKSDFFGLEENERTGWVLFHGTTRKGEFGEDWKLAVKSILDLKFGNMQDLNSELFKLKYNLQIGREAQKNRKKLGL
jgi:hypothetical protein